MENKLTYKGKYSCLIKETCVYFPLFVIRKKWSLIVDEAARQVGEGFDAAIATNDARIHCDADPL